MIYIILMLLTANYVCCQAQHNDAVFSIYVPSTKKMQTGFRLQGKQGIYTALHGVVDGQNYSAFNESNQIFTNLNIVEVDIEHDVAVLSNNKLDTLSTLIGLISGTSNGLHEGVLNYIVLGYPRGMSLFEKKVSIESTYYKQLRTVLPAAPFAVKLERRKSPNVDSLIIAIDGHLAEGQSGAPLVDESYHVYGIVGGGVTDIGIGWAMPIDRLNFVEFIPTSQRIQDLKQSSYTNLFAFKLTEEKHSITVARNGLGEYHSITDAIVNAVPGDTIYINGGNYFDDYTDANQDSSVKWLTVVKPLTFIGMGDKRQIKIGEMNVTDCNLINLSFYAPVAANGNCTIDNCYFNSWEGIDGNGTIAVKNCEMVADNDVKYKYNADRTGINLDFESVAMVTDCKIYGFMSGIEIKRHSNIYVENCNINRNSVGVRCMSYAVAHLKNSDLTGNYQATDTESNWVISGNDSYIAKGTIIEENITK